MNPRARGTFEVTLEPQPLSNSGQAANLNRLSIAKQYHGDLEATSHGEMLANGDRTEESGVYVALERVSGQLHGRSGTFVLYHNGLMVRGESRLVISVVPDSGRRAGGSGRHDDDRHRGWGALLRVRLHARRQGGLHSACGALTSPPCEVIAGAMQTALAPGQVLCCSAKR